MYILNEEYNNKIGLIVFYKKKCKHCISSKNKWANIASIFKYKFPIGVPTIYKIPLSGFWSM